MSTTLTFSSLSTIFSLFTFCLCLSLAYCSLRTSLLAIDDVRMPREGVSGRRGGAASATLAPAADDGDVDDGGIVELFFFFLLLLLLPFLLIFFPPGEGFFVALTISRGSSDVAGAREEAERKEMDDDKRTLSLPCEREKKRMLGSR